MRSLALNLYFYAFTTFVAMTLYGVAKLGSQRRMHRIVNFWGRGVRAGVHAILGSRIEVRGLENLPEGGPRLLVSKHQSELDVVMIAVLFPEASAIAMQELTKYPFFGAILRGLDVVLVSVEGGPQGRTQQAVEGALRMKELGRPMLIYPEGELMALGAKERYRSGVAHLYAALGVEAVPIAASLGVIWPRRLWQKRSGQQAAVEILPPIPPGLDKDAFMKEVETRIETATMALIREHAKGEVLAAAEDRWARGVNNHGEVVERLGSYA
ncbi:MAG: lysophospholipid acyltransferase family protein [Paracoccaceae bacterium]